MCDDYAFKSDGPASHEDEFPVDWHPHRGFDLVSYIKTGGCRHADSLGNRVTFDTPGMQWTSAGSGVEHAEAGATPAGEIRDGFQIWVNVPAGRKMDNPRYGSATPDMLTSIELGPGASVRLLAGQLGQRRGPFATVHEVQMLDFELQPHASAEHIVPVGLDSCFVYVYRGGGEVAGRLLGKTDVARLNADNSSERLLSLAAGESGLFALLFAGKRIGEPIAWHGPVVMNTQAEIRQFFLEQQRGEFPPVRVPWDYKRAAAAPDPRRADL